MLRISQTMNAKNTVCEYEKLVISEKELGLLS